MIRKIVVASTLVAAGTVAFAAPAFADNCFNASRSAQGDTSAATNAGTWWDVPEILTELAGLSPAQIETVMPVIEGDPRVPANFTVFYNPAHPGELAASMNPKNATDGTGIDHSEDYSTPVFGAIFEDVASALS